MNEPGSRRAQSTGALKTTAAELDTVDQLQGDALAVFCWSDIRPLRGAAAFIDWRMCGALSRVLEAGHFAGDAGEVMLMPASGRFGRLRLFGFGLGPTSSTDVASLRQSCSKALTVLRQAGAERINFAAPCDRSGELESLFVDALAAEVGSDTGVVASVLVAP